MKKKILISIMLVLAVLFSFALIACDENSVEHGVTVYTVRYVANYEGGGITKQDVEAGESFTPASAPVRDGYTFKGWFLSPDADAADAFSADHKFQKTITNVYAKWERIENTYFVTYKYRNFTPDVVAKIEGGKVTKPADPQYDEVNTFRFAGWYSDPQCGTVYDFDKAVTGDVTLYADWSLARSTIKFDANFTGAAAIAPIGAEIGYTMTAPQTPERARFRFDGWFTRAIGGDQFDFTKPVEAEHDGITLYAHWTQVEFIVTFDLNGGAVDKEELTAIIALGDTVEAKTAAIVADKLAFTGHVFTGWYTDRTNTDGEDDNSDLLFDTAKGITADMTIYAGWRLAEYTVSFDLNYEGAASVPTQTVKFGRSPDLPAAPVREGWVSIGWYTEKALTNQFTDDMTVDKDITLYLGWEEKRAEVENIVVTFYTVNARTSGNAAPKEYNTVTIERNSTLEGKMPEDPNNYGYYFAGWYTNQDLSESSKLNPRAAVRDNISVYGKMLRGYTMEAEAVNFAGKRGQGTSTNSNEEAMIYSGDYVADGNVSNGWFVRELYYNGAFLEFEINSKAEVDDAVLFLRVSSESYEFKTTKEKDGVLYSYLTDKEFIITVNGEGEEDALKYGGLYIPMANLVEKEDLSINKTPFEDMFIAANVHLNKGVNRIRVQVNNNNGHGGTFHAEAPMIDCLYIYTSASLTMVDYEYYLRENTSKLK